MRKILAFSLGLFISSLASAATFTTFTPVTGVLKGNASSPVTTAATSTDIKGLWSGTCNATTFLRGDGSCASATISTDPEFLSLRLGTGLALPTPGTAVMSGLSVDSSCGVCTFPDSAISLRSSGLEIVLLAPSGNRFGLNGGAPTDFYGVMRLRQHVHIYGPSAELIFDNQSLGTNEKEWGFDYAGGTLSLHTLADGEGPGTDFLTVSRSGITPTVAGFTANSFTFLDAAGGNTATATLNGSALCTIATGCGGGGTFANGTAAAPSITFTSDTNTGIFRSGADNLSITAGGVEQVFVNPSVAAFTNDGGSTGFKIVPDGHFEGRFDQNAGYLSSVQNVNAGDSAITGFIAENDDGSGELTIATLGTGYVGTIGGSVFGASMGYVQSQSDLSLMAGGLERIALSSAGTFVRVFPQVQVKDGTVSLPGLSFTNNTNAGLYRIGSNNLGISVAATKVADITTSVFNVTSTAFQVNGQSVRDAAILTSGTVGTARLGSGTADSTTFLRGDQTWAVPSGTVTSGTTGQTCNGFSGGLTCSVKWASVGSAQTCISFSVSGTSNATTFDITGIQAPAPTALYQGFSIVRVIDNSGSAVSGTVAISAGSNTTLTFKADLNGTAFTASGTKAASGNVCYAN